jgi:hypothetical protein
MATWPATLPAPNLAGYQLAPVDQSLRTDMESGTARSRRQTKARNDRLQVGWVFTDAQMDIFRTWFENDSEAAGGSAWFVISLRIGNTGATSQEARFIGPFQAVLQKASLWAVSAQLEVRDV